MPEDCEWLFPGEAEGKPLQDIKRFWEDVRAKAELPAVRIHDLRHTFAPLLSSGGMTLSMIGKLLGHTHRQHVASEAETGSEWQLLALRRHGNDSQQWPLSPRKQTYERD